MCIAQWSHTVLLYIICQDNVIAIEECAPNNFYEQHMDAQCILSYTSASKLWNIWTKRKVLLLQAPPSIAYSSVHIQHTRMPGSPDNSLSIGNSSIASSVALSTLEVQNLIFGFNEVGDAARCARVCKSWTKISLEHVWDTIYDINALFSILAPLKTTKSGGRVWRQE